MLSAKYGLHRTYAEYLMGKKRLGHQGHPAHLGLHRSLRAELFNEEYVEGLYRDYLNVEVDDENTRSALKDRLSGAENVLLVAPGRKHQ